MTDSMKITNIHDVVVLFAGDSGDGMQLAGNIFSTVSATAGNSIPPISAPRKAVLQA